MLNLTFAALCPCPPFSSRPSFAALSPCTGLFSLPCVHVHACCWLVSMYRPSFAALCPCPYLLPLPCVHVHAFFHCLVSMSTFFFKAFFCCLVSMYRPAAAALRPCHRVHIYFCCLLSMSILFFKALKATVLTALSNSHTVSCDKHSLQKIFPLLNISLCLHGAKV